MLTLLGMRFGPFHIVGFSLFALLSWITRSSQLSIPGQRELTQLSAEQLVALANSVDPVKNIDTHNPDSHLSRLLIPRPGALCIFDHRFLFFDAQVGT
jgi:glutaminyl-peptide cyclotransferase